MFYLRYYSGEKVAPVLTIFIGGNHEASNYLQELPYGGWVAPKIYYMGKILSSFILKLLSHTLWLEYILKCYSFRVMPSF